MLKRARDSDDNVIGRANENPILDTRGYIVEFEDGEQAELAANTIAQIIYAYETAQQMHWPWGQIVLFPP